MIMRMVIFWFCVNHNTKIKNPKIINPENQIELIE